MRESNVAQTFLSVIATNQHHFDTQAGMPVLLC